MPEKVYVSEERKAKKIAFDAIVKHGYKEIVEEEGLDQALLKFVQRRFEKCRDKSQHARQMFQIKNNLYEIGLRAYRAPNVYKTPYRSARFYHTVESWIDEITENYPIMSLQASTYRDRNAADKARGIEQVLNVMDADIGIKGVREQTIEDIGKLGTGIEYEYVDEDDGHYFINTRRVDPRCFFPDDACTDQRNMRDCIYQEEMTPSDFNSLYGKYKNVEEVEYGKVQTSDNTLEYKSRREIEDGKEDEYIVRVNHYFNAQFGFRITFANRTLIYANSISKIPFIAYYKKKPNDSFWGISAIEETAPEVFALDTLIELGFRSAKSRLQEMIIADGNFGYHQGLRQQPGGMWVLSDMPQDKKVEDTFARVQLGSIPPEFFAMRELFLDELSTSSQNDQRALQVNPNQLATQTRAKKESFAKRGRRNTRSIMWNSLKRRTEIRLDLLMKYIVPRNQDFYIDGYFVLQGETANPKFIRDSVGSGVFRLKKENSNVRLKVVVTDAKDKAQADEEEFAQLLQYFSTIVQAAQIDQKVAEAVNMVGIAKVLAEKKNLDKRDIFTDYADAGTDQIRQDQLRIEAELPPAYPKNDNVEELITMSFAHREYLRTRKDMSPKSRFLLQEHIQHILEKINKITEAESLDPEQEQGLTPKQIQEEAQMRQQSNAQLPQAPPLIR